jgi:hypothetical protein
MKKFTLTVTLFVLLIFWLAISVAASSMWNQTYGGPDNDSAGALVQTSDEGYAIAGYTSSFSDDSSVLCWLVKVDSSGNMEWNKTYGGQGNISPIAGSIAMVQTSDGGCALSCYTQGTFGDEIHTGFWLVKVDSSGNMEWNKTHWREGHNVAYSLVQTSDGGYAIAGEARGGDVWLVKTDSEGNIMWNRTYGGSDFDYAKSLVQTTDGGYALAGLKGLGFWSNTSGAWLPVVWLIKTDIAGNIEWNQTYGGEGTKYVQPLVQTTDGGYAMAGSTNAFGAGGSDFWLIKTDSSGNLMWNKTYGGADGDRALDLVQTSDGGYALAGFTQSFGAGVVDFWVVKTDPSGNMQWDQIYGGPDSDSAWAIVEATDGGYAIAGSTISFGAGKNDAWLIKTDEYGVIPEFPSWAPLLITLVAVVAAPIIYRHSLKKHQVRRNP